MTAMKTAIFARRINSSLIETLHQVLGALQKNNHTVCLYRPLEKIVQAENPVPSIIEEFFDSPDEINNRIAYFISIGGDGTFLQSIPFVAGKNIPIVGINNGRLGFLANIQKEEIDASITAITGKEYSLENRSLIQLLSPPDVFPYPYALNDLTIQKKGSSLITIHAYINGEYLNSYWTDGLIIATPTGSTAYAMSVGGPIVCPECSTFIIAPIASHNFAVRPLVVNADSHIKLTVESRNNEFLLTLDSYTIELPAPGTEIILTKAGFSIQTIKLKNHSFYTTIRNKLMWGADPRN